MFIYKVGRFWVLETNTAQCVLPREHGCVRQAVSYYAVNLAADAPNGGSWLLSGMEVSRESGERRWTIKKTWKSADAGAEWDEELYG